jgi:hypothetical protein
MSSKRIVSALAAVALVAAPTIAAAQVAPAPETVEGSELRGEGGVGQILPILAIIAIIFLIREIVKDRDIGLDNPASP